MRLTNSRLADHLEESAEDARQMGQPSMAHRMELAANALRSTPEPDDPTDEAPEPDEP